MTDLKYKGFDITINPQGDRMFTWIARNKKTGTVLGDNEGGELGTISNARQEIKQWIRNFLTKKYIPSDIIIVR